MNNTKTWSLWLLSLTLGTLLLICAGTIWIDPFFHYHKPVSFLEYPMDKE